MTFTPAIVWAIAVALLAMLGFTALLIVTDHTEELRSLILFGAQFVLQILILFKVHKNGREP